MGIHYALAFTLVESYCQYLNLGSLHTIHTAYYPKTKYAKVRALSPIDV